MADKLLTIFKHCHCKKKMNTTEAQTFGATHFSTYSTEVSPNMKSLLKVPLFMFLFKTMHLLMVPWAHMMCKTVSAITL